MVIPRYTAVLLCFLRVHTEAFSAASSLPRSKVHHLCLLRDTQQFSRLHSQTGNNRFDALTMKAEDGGNIPDPSRRTMWQKNAIRGASLALGLSTLAVLTRPAWASSRSRSDGYKVQKTDDEWKAELSDMQYFVLRQGGTERPGFSVLESEKRAGEFQCAGCGTPLFESKDKFNSGTGWPSFARGLDGVEVEDVGMFTAALAGSELRCKTCGGHLGDVFKDGFLFVGTAAAITGKRYCIDGAALVFYPSDDSGSLKGDQEAPKKLPSFLEPPTIDAHPKI